MRTSAALTLSDDLQRKTENQSWDNYQGVAVERSIDSVVRPVLLIRPANWPQVHAFKDEPPAM